MGLRETRIAVVNDRRRPRILVEAKLSSGPYSKTMSIVYDKPFLNSAPPKKFCAELKIE